MTEESREDEAQSRLVCAPCWICLEDGPDEEGEPLVRDCACRGETSAGYHLSCIFAYVKRKIDEELKREQEHGPPMSKDRGNIVESYTCCPNCTTPYMSNFALSLFDKVVELTENLPDTHYIRYDVLEMVAHAIFYMAKNSKTTTVNTDMMMTAFNMLQNLRNFVICDDKKVESLTNSFGSGFGLESAFEVRYCESTKLLLHQGQMLMAVADAEGKDQQRLYYEKAMNLFEMALQEIGKYERATGWTVYEDTKEDILEEVFEVKCRLGVLSITDEIQEFRQRFDAFEKSWSGSTDPKQGRAFAKSNLASVLLKAESPRYAEAIRLQKEAIIEYQTILGPDHSITMNCKESERRMKDEYREYLKCLASTKTRSPTKDQSETNE